MLFREVGRAVAYTLLMLGLLPTLIRGNELRSTPTGVHGVARGSGDVVQPQAVDVWRYESSQDVLGEPSFDEPIVAGDVSDEVLQSDEFSAERIRKLMRPTFHLVGEWQDSENEIGLATFDASVKFPTYPIFGPPPPMINTGFNYTTIDAPVRYGLPSKLYETEIGLSWMRKFNERWMARLMAGATFATDGENRSSDAWRFRGGAFALYRRNPQWTWTFGAIAMGRNDLPVIPAVGVIYERHPGLRYELIMPRPRVALLLVDNGPRQQWGYIGASLNGATWGVVRDDGGQDQLTYGDFRAVIGWESIPTPEPGMPFSIGRKLGFEMGYVFSRDFEFETDRSKVRLDDTFMVRAAVSF